MLQYGMLVFVEEGLYQVGPQEWNGLGSSSIVW